MNTLTMKTNEELWEEIAERRRIIDAREAKERSAKNIPLIGKCFKYSNSYGGTKPSERWWLYLKVLSADGHNLKAFTFQTDKNGKIEINPKDIVFRQLSDGYQPCSADEFDRAWRKVQAQVKVKP